MKGGGRAPPATPAWANFTLMMEYVQMLAASENQVDCKILAANESQADCKIQGFVIKGINHTGQIFLTRPSVSSCVRHCCHPLEKIPADLSDDWTFLIGHFIRLLDFSLDQ